MSKKIPQYSIFLLILSLLATPLLSEEGMWPPSQLPELSEQLEKLGLKLAPETLTDLTEYPMNAVISLGGCSASFVSPQGLVVTNHHCAYSSIQHNSNAENNLLEKGFLAATLEDELPAYPGSRVYVTEKFEDVTNKLLDGLSESLSGFDRYQEIDRRRKALIAECEATGDFRCSIASFYGGLKYTLMKQLEIRDVRLVYAPASGIGVFGGDIDNWMWPRHTGDYSFYRAYVAPNGEPADPSEDNVPYQPEHYLKVSSEGVQKGDFVMVAGYPGSTGRYRLASEVEETFEWSYPARIQAYQEWLEVIEKASSDNTEASIKYSSLKAGLNNALKNNRGMLEGFAKSTMLEDKRALEEEFQEWLEADPKRLEKFAPAVQGLNQALDEESGTRERDFYYSLAKRSSLLSAAQRLYRLAQERKKPDLERESGYQERDIPRIRQSLEALERRFDAKVDKAVLRHFLELYRKEVAPPARIEELDEWFRLDEEGTLNAVLDDMYAKTDLDEEAFRLDLLDADVQKLESSGDPFIQLAIQLYPHEIADEQREKEISGKLQEYRSSFMEGLIAFLESRGIQVYPDANSTLRVTFGTVKGYEPRDAVLYEPFTTIAGILEKDTGEAPFDTPEKALRAMREQRWDRFEDPGLDSIPVNFLSTVDTTGGNSGSPTLNGKGELVGLLFDGNYESMIADWDYLPEITRSIHVDMRYVLWLMEEVDHADRLLKEMGQ